ncbi:MAG: hypothetical protein ACSHYA_11845 [Opitutaceae bacterium]
MKTLILILIVVWSLAGATYNYIDMCKEMEIEATLDPDAPTPLHKTIMYGPLVWLFYLFGYIAIHLLVFLNDAFEYIRSHLRR